MRRPQAGARLVSKMVSVRMSVCVFVCVCVHAYVCVFAPKAINNQWRDRYDMIWTLYDWLSKFYSCYMAAVVIIINGRGLGIGTHHRH